MKALLSPTNVILDERYNKTLPNLRGVFFVPSVNTHRNNSGEEKTEAPKLHLPYLKGNTVFKDYKGLSSRLYPQFNNSRSVKTEQEGTTEAIKPPTTIPPRLSWCR